MKLGTTTITNPVVQGGIGQAKKFRIKADDSVAFGMLSSGLYSHPREAILRELGCNAVDAHDMVGNGDLPFDVAMPSRFDHNLRFRDYGPGLSHYDAEHVYTTYFESTKRDSNNQIGVVGLGSKSPLGYTQNFTINSYQAGKKRTYFVSMEEAVMGEGAIPHYRYMGEADTDEPDGLEIEIPCKDGDYYSWQAAARKVFQYFTVQPNFVRNDPDVVPVDFVDEVGSVQLMSKDASGHGSWFILQGPVAYPLELERLGGDYTKFKAVSGYITVGMGEVHFPPNREAVKYNLHTITNIQKHLDTFGTAYTQDVIKEIEAVTNYIELADTVERIHANKLAVIDKATVDALLDKGQTIVNGVLGYDLDKAKRSASYYAKKMAKAKKDNRYADYEVVKKARDEAMPMALRMLLEIDGKKLTTPILPKPGKMYPVEITKALLSRARGEVAGFPEEYQTVQMHKYQRKWTEHRKLIRVKEESNSITLYVNDTGKRAKSLTNLYLKNDATHEKKDIIMFLDEPELVAVEAFFKTNHLPYNVVLISELGLEINRPKGQGPSVLARVMIATAVERGNGWHSTNVNKWDRGLNKDEVLAEYDTNHYAWCECKGYDFIGSKRLGGFNVKSQVLRGKSRYDLYGVVAVKAIYVDEFRNDPKWRHIDDFVTDAIEAKLALHSDSAIVAHQLSEKLSPSSVELIKALHPVREDITDKKVRKLFGEVARHNNIIERSLRRAEAHGIEHGYEDGHGGADDIDSGLKKLYTNVMCLGFIAQRASSLSDNDVTEVVKLINEYT